jgi:hypothetical protein
MRICFSSFYTVTGRASDVNWPTQIHCPKTAKVYTQWSSLPSSNIQNFVELLLLTHPKSGCRVVILLIPVISYVCGYDSFFIPNRNYHLQLMLTSVTIVRSLCVFYYLFKELDLVFDYLLHFVSYSIHSCFDLYYCLSLLIRVYFSVLEFLHLLLSNKCLKVINLKYFSI